MEKNRLLVYFAGHGHTETGTDGRVFGYIVPVDAPVPDRDRVGFKRSAVSMDAIEASARLIETRHALFVFDSCFSGSLVSRSTVVPPEISDATAKAVRQFITSGAANQEVPDRSIFRDLFVRGIKGAADLNGDRYVTGSELAMYLKSQVTEYSRGAQTPQYGKIRDTKLDLGDYVFMVTGTPNPPPKMEVIAEPVPVGTLRVTAFNKGMEIYVNGEKAGVATYGGQKFTIKNVPARGTVEIRGRTGDMETVKRVAVGEGQETPVELMFDRIVNSFGMEFVLIPAGTFMMGSPTSETGRSDDEVQHEVRISQAFYMGKYEVTQREWKAVIGECLRCEFPGITNPVTGVSWEDTQEFIKKLNELEREAMYRLPSEAEWEYACRSGVTRENTEYLDPIAWYLKNSGGELHPVGQKLPNKWGLYDMYGNVEEWCEDWYGEKYYQNSANVDPKGPSNGLSRVCRGGSWTDDAVDCRSANRGYCSPSESDLDMPHVRPGFLGFRLVRRADR